MSERGAVSGRSRASNIGGHVTIYSPVMSQLQSGGDLASVGNLKLAFGPGFRFAFGLGVDFWDKMPAAVKLGF